MKKLILIVMFLFSSLCALETGYELNNVGDKPVFDITTDTDVQGPLIKAIIAKKIVEVDGTIIDGKVMCERGIDRFQSGSHCYKYECPVGSVDTGNTCTSLEGSCVGEERECTNGDFDGSTFYCKQEGECPDGKEQDIFGYCSEVVSVSPDSTADEDKMDNIKGKGYDFVYSPKMCFGQELNGKCYAIITISATEVKNLSCASRRVPCMSGASSCCTINVSCSGNGATVDYRDCCPNRKVTSVSNVSNFLSGVFYQNGVFSGSMGGKIICNNAGACSVYFQNGYCGGSAIGGTFLAQTFSLSTSTTYKCDDVGFYLGSDLGADPTKCYQEQALACPQDYMTVAEDGNQACKKMLYCEDDLMTFSRTDLGPKCIGKTFGDMGCPSSGFVFDSVLNKCVKKADQTCK